MWPAHLEVSSETPPENQSAGQAGETAGVSQAHCTPQPQPLCSSLLSLSSFPLDAPHDGGLSTTHGAVSLLWLFPPGVGSKLEQGTRVNRARGGAHVPAGGLHPSPAPPGWAHV